MLEKVMVADHLGVADVLHLILDEADFKDYREAEGVLETLKMQGKTVSGVPRIRPSDCGRAIDVLEKLFLKHQSLFRSGDPRYVERFEQIVTAFHTFSKPLYPGEALNALLLHAQVRLFLNDAAGALALVRNYAEKPYLIEGDFKQAYFAGLLYGQAHLQLGTLQQSSVSFISFARWLFSVAEANAPTTIRTATKFAPFAAVSGGDQLHQGRREKLIVKFSRLYVEAKRGYGRKNLNYLNAVRMALYLAILTRLYRSLRRSDKVKGPHSQVMGGRESRALVTRAMGGIGDLLMMSPGLRAIAKRTGQPVDFAIPKKFHPIFAANPNVNLVDIDGPPIEIQGYRYWRNLSICPAGRYESKRRPHVKKGRVELFAAGMGIKSRQWAVEDKSIEYHATAEDRAFCDDFLRSRRAPNRPLIGVQPYSRDSYKDHPYILSIISALSKDYDLLIFHHTNDGLPEGPGIYTTAGMPLGRSLAMVSTIKAMVSVDSAFLHAAAAFDVPVVALFGPTDGRPFTIHHKNAKILWQPQKFPCVPCWRNEDMPCALTGQTGYSPCITSITASDVKEALKQILDGASST